MSQFITDEMRRLAGITESTVDYTRFDRKSMMMESAPELMELHLAHVLEGLMSEDLDEQRLALIEAIKLIGNPKVTEPLVKGLEQHHQWKSNPKISDDYKRKHAHKVADALDKAGFSTHAKGVRAWAQRAANAAPGVIRPGALHRGGASSNERAAAEWTTKHDPEVTEFIAPVLGAIGRVAAGAGKAVLGAGKAVAKATIAKVVAPKQEPKPTEPQDEQTLANWRTAKNEAKNVEGDKISSIPKKKAKITPIAPKTEKEPSHPEQKDESRLAIANLKLQSIKARLNKKPEPEAEKSEEPSEPSQPKR
jgi:hypothetical protein